MSHYFLRSDKPSKDVQVLTRPPDFILTNSYYFGDILNFIRVSHFFIDN